MFVEALTGEDTPLSSRFNSSGARTYGGNPPPTSRLLAGVRASRVQGRSTRSCQIDDLVSSVYLCGNNNFRRIQAGRAASWKGGERRPRPRHETTFSTRYSVAWPGPGYRRRPHAIAEPFPCRDAKGYGEHRARGPISFFSRGKRLGAGPLCDPRSRAIVTPRYVRVGVSPGPII